jgi:hypothetical protein
VSSAQRVVAAEWECESRDQPAHEMAAQSGSLLLWRALGRDHDYLRIAWSKGSARTAIFAGEVFG